MQKRFPAFDHVESTQQKNEFHTTWLANYRSNCSTTLLFKNFYHLTQIEKQSAAEIY